LQDRFSDAKYIPAHDHDQVEATARKVCRVGKYHDAGFFAAKSKFLKLYKHRLDFFWALRFALFAAPWLLISLMVVS
jgi:hypothetical protein